MEEINYQEHELLKQEPAPPAETPNVPARDDQGRFASREESAPESDDNLEAVADDEASENEPAEAAESDESDEQETAKEEPKHRRRASDRISQLTAQRREAEARAAQAERDLQELREYLSQQVDPNLEFEDPAKFTQETVRRALAEQRYHDSERSIEYAREAKKQADREAIFERLEAMQDELPDFDEVVLNNPRLTIDEDMLSFLAKRDEGPRIAHYLGKHPSKSREIAAMHPFDKAEALRDLADEVGKPPPRKLTTKAPPPTRTIQATGPAGTFDPQRDGVDAFKRMIYGGKG